MSDKWVWRQPCDTAELLQRLADARDLNVSERERENLCACAHTEIERLQRLAESEHCVWTVENADECVWKPGCGGDLFVFNAGGPRENRFTFCPYCGGHLVAAVEYVDHDDDHDD